jgi:hypothetical protein
VTERDRLIILIMVKGKATRERETSEVSSFQKMEFMRFTSN